MSRITDLAPLARRPPRPAVLLCCLLSLIASLDLSFLEGYFDRYGPTFDRAALSELDETPEDDDDMICSPSAPRAGGRSDRHTPAGERAPAGAPGPAARRPSFASPRDASVRRSGCEHARRNGLGAPLLC